MKTYRIYLLITLLFLFKQVDARDNIVLGGVSIHLGSNKEIILKKLSKVNKVQKMKGENYYNVWDKRSNFLGIIEFKKNKVSFVSKSWGQFYEGESIKFISTLMGILSKLDKKKKYALISLQDLYDTATNVKEIKMKFDKIEISFGYTELGREKSLFINETLQK